MHLVGQAIVDTLIGHPDATFTMSNANVRYVDTLEVSDSSTIGEFLVLVACVTMEHAGNQLWRGRADVVVLGRATSDDDVDRSNAILRVGSAVADIEALLHGSSCGGVLAEHMYCVSASSAMALQTPDPTVVGVSRTFTWGVIETAHREIATARDGNPDRGQAIP